MNRVTDDRVPDDLAELVRQAAGAVPTGTHELARVARRRARQRRRTTAGAGLTAVAVAVTAVAVPMLLRSEPSPRPSSAALAPLPSASALPQSLLLPDTKSAVDMQRAGSAFVLEAIPNGQLKNRVIPGMDNAQAVAALPDGGLVALGPKDRRPDSPREDGVQVTGLDLVLTVTAPDGHVTVTRDVRAPGEPAQLVGAAADTAYLLRAERQLVAHDLGSGAERPLTAASAAIAEFAATQAEPIEVTVQADRVALTGQQGISGRGELRFFDLASGDRLGTATFEGVAPDKVRLSPDGRIAAVAGPARTPTGTADKAGVSYPIRAFDVATGKQLGEHQLYSADRKPKFLPQVLDLAFVDGTTFRVAWISPLDSPSLPGSAVRFDTVRI